VKAVWYERTGAAPDVLTYGDMPTPVAGPGEVRVRLEASGVNPADVGRHGGSYRAMEYPRVIPNSDGAGIVDQVGDGATRLKAGQRVWLFNGQRNGRAFGTAAEYIALAEHLVTPLPDRLSFAEGATLGIPGMTAWCCLFGDGPIAGRTVLVTGGAGAVGHYAVQLAKWGGAQVIATVSSAAKAEQARLAGADLVVNYKTEDVVAKTLAFTGQRGVDRVVDVDFGGNIETTLKLIGMNSTIAVYATNGNRTPVVPMRELMEKCIALRALVLFALPPPLLAAAQTDITKWLAAGPRIHNIAARFALSDTAQAHLAVEKGRQARHHYRRLRAVDDELASGSIPHASTRVAHRPMTLRTFPVLRQGDRPAGVRPTDTARSPGAGWDIPCASRPPRGAALPIVRWCHRPARATSRRQDRSARPRSGPGSSSPSRCRQNPSRRPPARRSGCRRRDSNRNPHRQAYP
jgi:NADPH2:quinone reductase